MERKDFYNRLSKGTLPSLLLFEGEEDNLKRTALKDLCGAFLSPGMEDMDLVRMEDPAADAIIAAAETIPFLSTRRIVIVRDYVPLVGRQEPDDKLLKYLPTVPSTVELVFLCTKKPDARKKLYTSIKKLDGIVTFSKLKNLELTRFVTDAFRTEGKECSDRVADALIFRCGSDTSKLLTEVAKIASHSSSPSVSPDEIELLTTPSAESTVFQMVDALVSGQETRAFSLMRQQLLQGETRILMLALFLRQFRLMQHIKIMKYEKKSIPEIKAALGVPPFAADQYIRQADAWSNGQVKRAVRLCLDMEYAVKSGRANQEGSLESIMIKLSLLRK